MADAFYVVLATRLGAELLTDDARLARCPALPAGLTVLTLPDAVGAGPLAHRLVDACVGWQTTHRPHSDHKSWSESWRPLTWCSSA